MANYKLHNDCKVLSKYVYKDNKPETINDWKYSKTWYDSNGFNSEVYKKGNDIIIVFRGTAGRVGNAINIECYND